MLNAWGSDAFEAFSAGTEATGIKPETIQVMDEIGLSLEGHRSKTIDEFRGQSFEWFITVCDEAQKNCPVLPGVDKVDHSSIDDPSLVEGTPDEWLEFFRKVRDNIGNRLRLFIPRAAGPTSRLLSRPSSAKSSRRYPDAPMLPFFTHPGRRKLDGRRQ